MFRNSILIFGLTSLTLFSVAQDDEYFSNKTIRYDNYIYKESIKTPLIYRQGFELSYPVVELNTNDTIILSFDDLADNIGNYSYTLIHCNSNWLPTSLSPNDYIDGFIENPVTDYNPSFNTFCNYFHYKICIPNENIRIKLSGNYLLMVYENGDKENLVLTRRFFVVESKTEINAQVKRATQIDLMKSHQEIDFILRNAFTCNDPFQDIKVIISQNYRWDNVIKDLKPLFIKDNELTYNYEEGNIFPGGSEFRWFDGKSVTYQAERIQSISYQKPYYHFYMAPDEKRTFKIYFQSQDINGKFLVKNSKGIDSDVEADYVYVHFSLPYEAPLIDGNIYVFGAISDWRCTTNNMLKYNYENKTYELSMFVKQGFLRLSICLFKRWNQRSRFEFY